jgi:hypothetical protein
MRHLLFSLSALTASALLATSAFAADAPAAPVPAAPKEAAPAKPEKKAEKTEKKEKPPAKPAPTSATQPAPAPAPPPAPVDVPWPPALPGAVNGTLTLTGPGLLAPPTDPEAVKLFQDPNAIQFDIAKTPPTIDLAYHQPLRDCGFVNGSTGWTSWGDIAIAPSGKVYCAIGNHGKDHTDDGQAYLFEYDPAAKTLTKVVDLSKVVTRSTGQEPSWTKVHAKIDVGPDGGVYFTGTLNGGDKARDNTKYHWSPTLPGGQLYRYDPKTGKTAVFANLAPARVTATSLLDAQRNRWWCNLEAGPEDAPNALYAMDLSTGKGVFQSPNGAVGLNRAFALAKDGSIYFNAKAIDRNPVPTVAAVATQPKGKKPPAPAPLLETPLMKMNGETGKVESTKSLFIGSAGMRSATSEGPDGFIYGTTSGAGRLFRYSPANDTLELLGPDFLTGNYTTVMVRSPDEKYLYYLPGAHGGATKIGTPVVQYEIATGKRKVIAFLRDALQEKARYTPGGSYGVKLSADGSTLYANLNGHATDPAVRHPKMRENSFGLTGFVAIHIPEEERK